MPHTVKTWGNWNSHVLLISVMLSDAAALKGLRFTVNITPNNARHLLGGKEKEVVLPYQNLVGTSTSV